MPQFQYKAFQRDGTTAEGVLDAGGGLISSMIGQSIAWSQVWMFQCSRQYLSYHRRLML
jgi:hypothetical protein